MPRKLTAADVREVTGYNRHELRGLLDELPCYGGKGAKARVAREFSRHDLISLAVARELENTCGMRRQAIASVFDALRAALSGPRALNPEAQLHIMLQPPRVRYLEHPAVIEGGLVLPLKSVFQQVDTYLGVGFIAPKEFDQADLQLGPTVIAGKKRKNVS
jgi:hypothetical protein